MSPSLLVIGSSGQLARSLAERAESLGLPLVLAGRPELDLLDSACLRRAVANCDAKVVVNAAAYTAVDRAEAEPELAKQINAVAPGVLAAAVRERGARLIHVSTDYVFDGRNPAPYAENAPVNPLGVYGRTKLAGEQGVRAAAPEAMIVRTAWVYSPFGRNFVRTMLDIAREHDEVRVVDDQVGNPTSALDLADGLLTVARAWLDGGNAGLNRTYHLAGMGSTSWAGLARETFEISRRSGGPWARVVPIRSSEYPTPAARPLNSRLNSGAFTEDFGYSAPRWEQSLAATVTRLLAEPTA